jgi:hypothetical protein
MVGGREYRMIGRGTDDLASPAPSPGSKLSLFLGLPVCRLSSLGTGEGRGSGRSQIIQRREILITYKSLSTLGMEESPFGLFRRLSRSRMRLF